MANTPLLKDLPHPLPASPHLRPLPPALGNPRRGRSGSGGFWNSINEHWRTGALFLAVAIPVPAAAFSGMAIPLPTAVERLAAALITGRTDIVSDVDAATVQALQAIEIADIRGQIELDDLIFQESDVGGAGAGGDTGLANSDSGSGIGGGPSTTGGGQSGPTTVGVTPEADPSGSDPSESDPSESDPPEPPSKPPVTNDDAVSSPPVSDPPAPPAEPTLAPVAPSFDTDAGAAPDSGGRNEDPTPTNDAVVTDAQEPAAPPKSPKPPKKPKPPKEDKYTEPASTKPAPAPKPPKKPKPPKEDKYTEPISHEMNGSAAGANAGVESGSTNSRSEQQVNTEPSQTAEPKKHRGKKRKR